MRRHDAEQLNVLTEMIFQRNATDSFMKMKTHIFCADDCLQMLNLKKIIFDGKFLSLGCLIDN